MSKGDIVTLGFLNYHPMHGYEMMNMIEIFDFEEWAGIRKPTVYKSLQRLSVSGHVSCLVESVGNSPARKVYSITQSGKDYLKKLVHKYLSDPSPNSSDFMLGVSFMVGTISKAQLLVYIDQQLQRQKQKLLTKQELLAQTAHNDTGKPSDGGLNMPFHIKLLEEMGKECDKVQMLFLTKLKLEAVKPENQMFFKD